MICWQCHHLLDLATSRGDGSSTLIWLWIDVFSGSHTFLWGNLAWSGGNVLFRKMSYPCPLANADSSVAISSYIWLSLYMQQHNIMSKFWSTRGWQWQNGCHSSDAFNENLQCKLTKKMKKKKHYMRRCVYNLLIGCVVGHVLCGEQHHGWIITPTRKTWS